MFSFLYSYSTAICVHCNTTCGSYIQTTNSSVLWNVGNLVCVDNIKGSRDISTIDWPKEKHTLLVFGQEQVGVPKEFIEVADDIAYIPQYGTVRSLNVGTASGIAMHEYCRTNCPVV